MHKSIKSQDEVQMLNYFSFCVYVHVCECLVGFGGRVKKLVACREEYNNTILMQWDNLLLHLHGEGESKNFLST